MQLYRDFIIDLYKQPLNRRAITDADITASGANVTCGDRVRVYAKTGKDGALADISFEGEGCAISIAAASLLTEEARGKMPEEILSWNALAVFKWIGSELGPSRVKCGLLALETLQSGIKSSA